MKKLFFALLVLIMVATACTKHTGTDDSTASGRNGSGSEDNPNGGGGNNTTTVPIAVLSVFKTRYPDATRIEWKKLADGNYKAEFFRGAVKWQVILTPSGNVVKEEHV